MKLQTEEEYWNNGIAAGHRRKVNLKNDCLYILLDDCDLEKTISNVYLLLFERFLVEHEVRVQVAGCLSRGRMKVKTLPRLICNSAALGREIII